MRIRLLSMIARAMGVSFKIGGMPYGASPKSCLVTSATQSQSR